jgi:hypothetical protein
MRISVFVPAPESRALASIKPGSGIVAQESEDLRPVVQIDYEGDLYNASNLVTFADRVKRAWQRQSEQYPTIARMAVDRGELCPVGWFDPAAGVVHCDARGLLARWLEVESLDERELRCTS